MSVSIATMGMFTHIQESVAGGLSAKIEVVEDKKRPTILVKKVNLIKESTDPFGDGIKVILTGEK